MSADRGVVAADSAGPPTTTAAAAAAPTAAAHASTVCANCGATVSGHYCANCGQRVEHAVHSLRHFISEVAEDLTHADSRLWRTVSALLFKPGYLTNEFLAGRRMKYLPPFRLYLVLSLLFFVVVALNSTHGNGSVTFAQIQAAATSDEDKEDLKILSDAVPVLSGEYTKQHAEKGCANLQYDGPWKARIQPVLRTSCLNVLADNGHSLKESFLHNLPRAIFLLLPILAAVMKPLYGRPPRYFVEHLLFLLHNHAFAFLALGLFVVAGLLIPSEAVMGILVFVVGLYIPYYYYRAMRRVYGESPARTFGKLTVLSLAYAVTAGIVLVATATYSVLVA